MPSHVLRRGIPTAALLVSLLAPAAWAAPVQDGSKAQGQDSSKTNPQLSKLNRLLEEIRKLIESQIPAAAVEARLKGRTAKYQTIKGKVEDLPKPTVTQPAAATGVIQAPKARLLGDAEKQDLADGTVMLVDGIEIAEAEVRELAKYLASYEGGKVEDKMTDALQDLILIRAMEAKFKDRVPEIKKEIEGLHKRVAAGEDFATLATKHSDGPSKTSGGDLGMSPRTRLVPSFARWAFTLAPGKVSPVFASRFGYHILKVTEKNKGETAKDDQVRVSHILKTFSPDPNQMGALLREAEMGQNVHIAVIDDEWRKRLPQVYQ